MGLILCVDMCVVSGSIPYVSFFCLSVTILDSCLDMYRERFFIISDVDQEKIDLEFLDSNQWSRGSVAEIRFIAIGNKVDSCIHLL